MMKLLHLLKKDLRLMVSGRFFLLALGSLVLYSCYIGFFYADVDQGMYPVYLYDPRGSVAFDREYVTQVKSIEALKKVCEDGMSVGIDASTEDPNLYLRSCGIASTDRLRRAWAASLIEGISKPERISKPHADVSTLSSGSRNSRLSTSETDSISEPNAVFASPDDSPQLLGSVTREQKNRRDMTAECLFFELSAVGFLGLASLLFKEKQMGALRVHGILPVKPAMFLLSKLTVFLISDLVFSALMILINLGAAEGVTVLPGVLLQAGILSLIMALTGFCCAVLLPDFRQFSLVYLILAVFLTTPVFLVVQAGITWKWMYFHPMYHLFSALKDACYGVSYGSAFYYSAAVIAILVLFFAARYAFQRELTKEG